MQRWASTVARQAASLFSEASTAGRRLLSTEANAALGGGAAGKASVIEQAAQARLQKIKTQLELSGELQPQQPPSAASKALRYFWNTFLLGTAGAGSVAVYYTYAYDNKELNQQLKEAQACKDNSIFRQAWYVALQKYADIRRDLESKVKDFTDPTYHKLLPDMHPELRGRVKTLVLDLDDLLVHKEWTRQKGWTIYKRPGVQDFILEMGQYYEIVIYTDEPSSYADPILNRLDSHKIIPYRLYRPETQYHNGKHVRDLGKLNRDLSQVLMISSDPDAWAFQPENTLKLKPWKNDTQDTTLLDLIPFLQMVAMKGVKDVREVVKSYDGEEDVPRAFKQRLQAASTHSQQHQHKRIGFLGGR